MCIVNTWLATGTSESLPDVYTFMDEELIDNTYDEGFVGLGQRVPSYMQDPMHDRRVFKRTWHAQEKGENWKAEH